MQIICSAAEAALHGLMTKIATADVLPSVERDSATIIDNRTASVWMT